MVLVHRGRRSGQEYRTPLNYGVVDGQVHCLAGFGGATDWYRNALAAPTVELWLPGGWWEAAAIDVSAVPERMELMRAVLIGSGFAAYVAGIDAAALDRLATSGKDRGLPTPAFGANHRPYRSRRPRRSCLGLALDDVAAFGRSGAPPPALTKDPSHRAV